MYYALVYTLHPDYFTKRESHRPAHFDYVKTYLAKDQFVMGGAFEKVEDGALLIFDVDDENIITEFAKNDPYVINGVVTAWQIKKWNVALMKQP